MGLYMLQMLMLINYGFKGTFYPYSLSVYFCAVPLFRIARVGRGMWRLGRDSGVGGLEMMIQMIRVVVIYVTGGSRTI